MRKKMWTVPDAEKIAREMAASSQIKLVVNRFLKLSLKSKVDLAWSNLPKVVELAKRDYAMGVGLLMEMEILGARDRGERWTEVVLHQQILDMSLAVKNRKILMVFWSLCQRYRLKPVLATANLGELIKFLSGIKRPSGLAIKPVGAGVTKKEAEVLKEAGIDILGGDR